MPRGSLPGERRGGRQRGTPNKQTALRDAAIFAAAADPNFSPLDFLCSLMRDTNLSKDRRVTAAQAALPYVHAKPRGRRPDGSGPRKYGAPVGRVNVRRRISNEGLTEAAAGSSAAPQDVGRQDVPPLDFLLGLMRDPQTPPHLRIRLAHIVAPYVHLKIAYGTRPEDTHVVDDPFGFVIDPAVAMALRDDKLHVKYLEQTPHMRPAGDHREQQELLARIEERERALKCPAEYAELEAGKDQKRLNELERRRNSPRRNDKLTEEEDVEEAHLMARLAVYHRSPQALADAEARSRESEARSRIFELTLKSLHRRDPTTAEELAELANLKALYPDEPPAPETKPFLEAIKKALERERVAEAARAAQRAAKDNRSL
jgi:hypothetical protein